MAAVHKCKWDLASELALQLDTPRRTRRSGNADEMAGDGEDDGEQHPEGGGAEAGPEDGPPGLQRRCRCAERRHGPAAGTRQMRLEEVLAQQE